MSFFVARRFTRCLFWFLTSVASASLVGGCGAAPPRAEVQAAPGGYAQRKTEARDRDGDGVLDVKDNVPAAPAGAPVESPARTPAPEPPAPPPPPPPKPGSEGGQTSAIAPRDQAEEAKKERQLIIYTAN